MFFGWLYMVLVPGLLAPSTRWWLCLLPAPLALTFVIASNSRVRNWRNLLKFDQFRRGQWGWWLLLIPAVVARSWAVSLPAVALLALLTIARRRNWRLRFELEGVRFLALTTMLSPVGLVGYTRLLNRPAALELSIACFMLSLAAVTLQASTLCAEFMHRSAPTWLAQPLSVSRLVFEKWAVPAGVTLLSLVQIELLTQPSPHTLAVLGPTLACLLGGFTVPLALYFKDTLTSAFLSLLAVAMPLIGTLWLRGELDQLESTDYWLRLVQWALPAASVLGVLLSVKHARHLTLVTVARARVVAFSPGRTSSLRAQVMKELRLQAPAVGLMGAMVMMWALTRGEVRLGATVVLGLVVAALAGMTPALCEKQYGTNVTELSVLPLRWVWRVKTGAAALVAFAGGCLLPGVLVWLVEPPTFGWSTVTAAASWSAGVFAIFALGVVASVLFAELKNAFACVVISAQVALGAEVCARSAGRWVGAWASVPFGLHAVPLEHPTVDQVMGLAINALPAAGLAVGALMLARHAQVVRRLAWRPTVRVFGATLGLVFLVNAVACLLWYR